MNLQNLLKQFGNLNASTNNLNKQYEKERPVVKNQQNLYPESFNTVCFDKGTSNNCNISCSSDNSQNISQNLNNNQNSNYQNIGYNQNENYNNTQYQNENNGQGLNLSSLISLFSMFKGKPNLNSILSSEQIPDGIKQLAPLINMLSKEDKKDKKDEIIIDDLKKIE